MEICWSVTLAILLQRSIPSGWTWVLKPDRGFIFAALTLRLLPRTTSPAEVLKSQGRVGQAQLIGDPADVVLHYCEALVILVFPSWVDSSLLCTDGVMGSSIVLVSMMKDGIADVSHLQRTNKNQDILFTVYSPSITTHSSVARILRLDCRV